MRVAELVSHLAATVPPALQESYDNSGLQVGNPGNELTGAILALDVTMDVLLEAAETGCNIIISHHPLIFGGIKSITPATRIGKVIIEAVKRDIAIYSAHTNLDMIEGGVSYRMAAKLGLKSVKVLSPLDRGLVKIAVFVPEANADAVRKVMFDAGAGTIGKYDHCSFNIDGRGTFRASEEADPFIGERGADHSEPEVRIEMVMPDYVRESVVSAMIEAHPYEEVAYDIYRLENRMPATGLGAWGILEEPAELNDFLEHVKNLFGTAVVRYAGSPAGSISRVALCGGAGSSLAGDARRVKADIFLTGDIKYHSFFETGNNMVIADIGHYESEKFSLEILYEIITKKFPKFAVRFSKHSTNPINYL